MVPNAPKARNGLSIVWEGWIAGLSYHKYFALNCADKLRTADLIAVAPVDNEYDSEAVGVFWNGCQIGWIPKNSEGILPILLRSDKKPKVNAVVIEHRPLHKHLGQTHYQECVYIAVYSDYWRLRTGTKEVNTVHQTKQTVKEIKMSKIESVVAVNKTAISTAAQLEAGRIANKYASKLISGKLPLMVRGYADTPVARLLLANTVSFVVTNYSDKLGDKAPIVQAVADAMVVSAYSEMLAHFDIDGFIEDFLSSKEMKRVGSLLKTDEEEQEQPRRRRNINNEGDK